MGGKSKQSQRTKNNVRPSSSGRSAEILNNAVKMDTGVVLLKTGKPLPVFFPTLVNSSPESVSNPEISICFKKFTKKDPITKTKALQELTDLIKTSDVNDIVASLPNWAHFYPILSMDSARKVREAAQWCHGAIMSTCGRRAAPHIRRLLPAWLLAYHDDHAPAQSAARHHLQNTFPGSKLDGALLFCKSEIITLLIDNLTGNAEAMLSNKIDDAEERAAGAARVLCASLRALEMVARRLPVGDRADLHGALAAALRTPAWWRHASHDDTRVRSAWYSAMGRIAEQLGGTLGPELGSKVARALVAQPEPAAAPSAARWSALLLLMDAVPEWHTWLDKKDLLVKRLLNLLENGAWGEAQLPAGLLQPLLARLPPDLLTDQLYITIFDALYTGLKTKSVLSSKSERHCWITNIGQCIQYLSMQKEVYVTEVVTYAHRSWLENVCTVGDDSQRRDLIKHTAVCMATLLKHWLRQSKEHGEKYDQLVRNYWLNIGSTITTHIDKLSTNEEQIIKAVEDHALLLITMEKGFFENVKKHSIKFEPDETEDVKVDVECDPSIADRFRHNLDELVANVCYQYFTLAKEKQVPRAVFPYLYKLLEHFDREVLFVTLARSMGADSVYGLYDKELRPWLSGDTMRCKTLVDVVLMTTKYLSVDEQDRMYSSFQQFPPCVVEWYVSRVLESPYSSSPAVRTWLRSATVDAAVVGLFRRETDEAARSLLMQCFSAASGDEKMLSEATISKVVGLCAAGLSPEGGARALPGRLALAQRLCCAVAGSAQRDLCVPLLVAVYRNYLIDEEENVMENEGREYLRDAVAKLDARSRQTLAAEALAAAHDCLRRDVKKLNLTKVERVVSLCVDLLPADVRDSTEILGFSKRLFELELPMPATPLEVPALRADCIYGYINCPIHDNDHIKVVIEHSHEPDHEFTEEDLLVHSNKCVYRAHCLRLILSRTESGDAELWNAVLGEDPFQRELAQVVYDCVLLSRLEENYGFWQYYEVLKMAKEHIEFLLDDILTKTPKLIGAVMLERLSEIAVTKGYYWAFARKLLQTKLVDIDKINNTEEITLQTTNNETEDKRSGPNANKFTNGKPGEETSGDGDAAMWFDEARYKDIITGCGYFHCLQAEGRTRGLALVVRSAGAAHATDAPLLAGLARAAAAHSVDPLIEAYYQHNHLMLFDRNLTDVPWSHVVSNATILDYLNELVAESGWQMSALQWDYVNISVCSLISSLQRSADNLGCLKVATIGRPALALAQRVRAFAAEVRARAEREQPSDHVIALPKEWEDIFGPDLCSNVATLMMLLLKTADKTMSASLQALIDGLVPIIRSMQWIHIPAGVRGAELSLQRVTGTAAAALLRVTHHTHKLLAYFALELVTDALVDDDRDKLAAWSERADDGERPDVWPQRLEPVRRQLQQLVDAALAGVRLGEEACHMVPFTDSHSVVLASLALALALHRMAERAHDDLAIVYIDHFRSECIAEDTLSTALRLLPAEADSLALGTGPLVTPSASLLKNFNSGPHFEAGGRGAGAVESLACRALQVALGGAGAGAARAWALDHEHALQALRRLVPLAIAPTLVDEQMQRLRENAHRLPDAQIRRMGNEVTCLLAIEDHTLELNITLAADHPLTPPSVTTSANSPVPDTLWLSLYLAHQNGTLLNAMRMWIRSVTGRVESSTQCFICYCRMHPRSGHLPTVPCRQCGNRFHAACLRKWVATSGKSICPLCRTHF